MSFDDMTVYDFMRSKLRWYYQNSPNMLGLIKALSVPIQDRVNVYEYLLSMEGIDEKTGTLLDQVGSKIGTPRPLAQVPDDDLFTVYDEDEIGDWWDESTGYGEEDEDELGGYLVDEDGLDTVDNEKLDDASYRILLKQKAATFRSKMNDSNLYEYFLVFGAPVAIDESDILEVTITPENDGDLTQWERWYIQNKGFKPAGIRVKLEQTNGALSL